MENENVTAIVLLDLSAAFDTVDHSILLDVLKHRFGLQGSVLEWFKNYLSPRYFKICTDGIFSTERELKYSVPQGSLNGPYLYLAYASTIVDAIEDLVEIYGFPDDHAISKDFMSETVEERNTIELLETALLKIKH